MGLRVSTVGLLVLALGLAACGRSPGEQAVIGGAAGVAAGVIANESLGRAAAIGAAGNVLFCQVNPHRCR